jgi:tetrapyrrole methylase family protein/MazG family protein/ATP diphosphatase
VPAPAIPTDTAEAQAALTALLELMVRLRDPKDGCPWDLEQNFATIAPYTIEEAYEVADAIARGSPEDLADELGDLLFQVVFHAQMAQEAGLFDFGEVARGVTRKMVRRHPHVFGDAEARTSEEQTRAWEAIKARERAAKAAEGASAAASVLDGVPVGLPALTRALKLSKRAARVGFAWPSVSEILAKLQEEVGEFEAEVRAEDRQRAGEELGDILFVCANLARELDLDPEDCLRGANAKFVRRFTQVEQALAAAGSSPEGASLAEMEDLWAKAKAQEKSGARNPEVQARSGPP